MEQSRQYIVIDFDGTVVKHRYPAVGEDRRKTTNL